jgi:hypothetical protein
MHLAVYILQHPDLRASSASLGAAFEMSSFMDSSRGSSTAAQPFRLPAGADVLLALDDSDHPAKLIHRQW